MEAFKLEPKKIELDKLLTISYDEYAAIDAVRCSTLSDLKKSPMHCNHWSKFGQPPTDAKDFGTMFHSAILEPEEFKKLYIVAPKIDKRTKAGKEEYAEFQTAHSNKILIDHADFETLQGMIASIYEGKDESSQMARKLLTGGAAEISTVWSDPETGLKCKARTDYIRPGCLVDLKKTRNAEASKFAWSIWDYGYHRQAAWYLEGFGRVTEKPLDAFYWIAIEDKAPYPIAVHRPSMKMLESGRDHVKALLKIYAECSRSNLWPGYKSGELDFPDALLNKLIEIESM